LGRGYLVVVQDFTKIPMFSVVPTVGLLGCFVILSPKSGGAGELGAGSENKLALGGNFSYTVPLLLILCVEE
jgi:hypothetical protein